MRYGALRYATHPGLLTACLLCTLGPGAQAADAPNPAAGAAPPSLAQTVRRFGEALDGLLSGNGFGQEAAKPTPARPDRGAEASMALQNEPSPGGSAGQPGQEEPVEFDPVFLGGSQKLDLSKFARSGYIQPGLITVAVRLNSVGVFTDAVRFEAGPDGSGQPCLSTRQMARLGIQVEAKLDESRCHPVARLAPGARYTFDAGEQVLELTVAQAYVRAGQHKWLDPSLWSPGIAVLHSQYSLSANDSWNDTERKRYFFGRFDNTVSAHGWQFKNSFVWNQSPQSRQAQSLVSYARTDLPSIKGELRIGKFYTSGILLDSLNLSGVSLHSYDEFLSENELGYAPVIRGTADSNATITVSQNGLEIYKTQVPPGPFVISDLRGAGYSGTLQVTITEASGLQKTFLAPYSAQVQMVRQGRLKYGLNIGQLDNGGLSDRTGVAQLSAQYGLFSTVTVYAGATRAQFYHAELLGLALSTFAGTLSYDETRASARFDAQTLQGRRGRMAYSKTVESSRTFIQVSSTSSADGNYLSLNDAVLQRHPLLAGSASVLSQRLATLAQPLGEWGDISLSLVRNRYTGSAPDNHSYTLGWRQSVAGTNLTVSATRQLVTPPGQSPVNSLGYAVQLNIPLQKIMGSMGLAASSSGGVLTTQAYHNQTLGPERQLQLNLSASTIEGQGSSSNGSLSYQSHLGTHAMGLSTGAHYKSLSYASSGGVALHAGGLTWGALVSDTMAIVHAPGAQGARVNGNLGSRVDRQGYALVPNLQPYRVNQVYLDPQGIGQDVELTSTSQQTIVRSGAVAQLNFSTVTGRGLMLTLQASPPVQDIPFGATVSNAQGREVGVVGQGGRVFLREVGASERLHVHWGQASDESCFVNVQRPPPKPQAPYDTLWVRCQ